MNIKKYITKSAKSTIIFLAYFLTACTDRTLSSSALHTLYSKPIVSKHQTSVKVFHLGHSLVGRTMPLMLKQLAGESHEFRSQLGWGATLKSHWEPDIAVNGFEQENTHRQFQHVSKAITDPSFNVYVLTEMVEIKDAIQYFQSAKYLSKFVKRIKESNTSAKIYVYESWHEYTTDDAWLSRLENDYQTYWLNKIVDKSHKTLNLQHTIYTIPVGQVMLALFRTIEKNGALDGLSGPKDIFKKNEDGSLDNIHVNELGEYLVALVHYAVIYQKSPVGLPYKLTNEFGIQAQAPSQEAAYMMQEVTWQVVSSDFRTGLTPIKSEK